MPLDSGGRVLLKISDDKGRLLISKPFPNAESAEKWFKEYEEKSFHKPLHKLITEMVPRI